jgi:hypothetical protein
VEEFLPVGPLKVSFYTGETVPLHAHMRVSGVEVKPVVEKAWATIQIDSIVSHELVILE